MLRNELVHADEHAQVMYRSSTASEGLDPLEVQANQFAASLLMPSRLLRDRADKLQRPLFEDDVRTLADEFKVSEQSMTIRLTTLGACPSNRD
jgi:Zn-dependent peptidase ImmA (M78 family)